MGPNYEWYAREKLAKEWAQTGDYTGMYRALGHWVHGDDLAADELLSKDLPAVTDFVAMMIDGRPPPAFMCDLHPEPFSTVGEPSHMLLRTLTYQDTVDLSSGTHTQETWYMLHSIGDQPLKTSNGCSIFTSLATNVLHVKRGGWWCDGDNVLLNMVSRGLVIRLLLPTTNAVVPSAESHRLSVIEHRPLGIGIKPNGVVLTLADYRDYAQIRNDLLRGPVGCAALLEGGLFGDWRSMSAILKKHYVVQT